MKKHQKKYVFLPGFSDGFSWLKAVLLVIAFILAFLLAGNALAQEVNEQELSRIYGEASGRPFQHRSPQCGVWAEHTELSLKVLCEDAFCRPCRRKRSEHAIRARG